MSILRKRSAVKVIDSRDFDEAGEEFWSTHPHPMPDVPLDKYGLPDPLPEPDDPDDEYEFYKFEEDEGPPEQVSKTGLVEMREVLERRYGLPPR